MPVLFAVAGLLGGKPGYSLALFQENKMDDKKKESDDTYGTPPFRGL